MQTEFLTQNRMVGMQFGKLGAHHAFCHPIGDCDRAFIAFVGSGEPGAEERADDGPGHVCERVSRPDKLVEIVGHGWIPFWLKDVFLSVQGFEPRDYIGASVDVWETAK
ncbi:hypothetical protein AAJCM20276_20870 [Acetobacter aceti]|uniref:Uncharacterized protein n=1 Tax=Acetobacter aceti TaxID=435 RepID=A0A6S6PJF3_ACEAC|nr:hypothetical protein AAJCM20276_20870 [Acetobacter aceti]